MKKVFFCYLDVLGFKNALKNKSETEQVGVIESLFGYISYSISNFIEQPDKTESIIDLENTKTNSILISDTILIWTNNSSYEDLIEFIYKIQGIIKDTFMGGFPLRGTIEYGSIYHKERLIPAKNSYNHFDLIGGSALMDAYKEEQNFDWMGCTLSSKCIVEVKKVIQDHGNVSNFSDNDIFQKNILIEYSVPKKTGNVEKLFTVNWVDPLIKSMHAKDQITSLFKKHCETQNIISNVKKKIYNTNLYIKYIIENELVTQLIFKK